MNNRVNSMNYRGKNNQKVPEAQRPHNRPNIYLSILPILANSTPSPSQPPSVHTHHPLHDLPTLDVLLNGLQVRVIEGVLGTDSVTRIVDEHLAEQVQGLLVGQGAVVRVDELRPVLLGVLLEHSLTVVTHQSLTLNLFSSFIS